LASIRRVIVVLAGVLFAPVLSVAALAQPASAGPPDPALLEDLVAANRILADQGVVDGFGHVSVRHDKDPNRYLMSRNLAPALVTAEDILEYDLDSNPVDARGRALFLERFIHGEIYKARPDVRAVVHSHSPAVIPFSVTSESLKPVYHMAGFLGAGVPVFDIRRDNGMTNMLVTNGAIGRQLAATLGGGAVVLMRGHGSVTVGNSLPQVVFRAVYTEVNARLAADALRLGPVSFLSPEEAEKAAATIDGQSGRPWELWKKKALGR
jgi:ribulose-5-phosphate 4-epimerase/fuculose-1-phosphate aldolase